jgi:hypothetical protein
VTFPPFFLYIHYHHAPPSPADHGLLCGTCIYDHTHLKEPCNIKVVKLEDIVAKWDDAHKDLQLFQSQFNLVQSNIRGDFPLANLLSGQPRDGVFVELEKRFSFFSDATSNGTADALRVIEDAMKPLSAADPIKECEPATRSPSLLVCA